MTAKKIIFTGNVQGVGFRYTTHSIARQWGLSGFVRNLSDGSVEMLAQGKAEAIDSCLQDIKDAFRGYIRQTEIEDVPANERFKDFRITF